MILEILFEEVHLDG